jgi:hypothetical protein
MKKKSITDYEKKKHYELTSSVMKKKHNRL